MKKTLFDADGKIDALWPVAAERDAGLRQYDARGSNCLHIHSESKIAKGQLVPYKLQSFTVQLSCSKRKARIAGPKAVHVV